jgi:hypothetical protein
VLYLNLGGVDVRPGDLIVTHSGTLGWMSMTNESIEEIKKLSRR